MRGFGGSKRTKKGDKGFIDKRDGFRMGEGLEEVGKGEGREGEGFGEVGEEAPEHEGI